MSALWRQASDAVEVWWSDPEYLDDDGRPRELPEFGPAPSIEALLSRFVDANETAAAKQLLRRSTVSVVRRRWRFDGDSPFIRLTGDAGFERLLMTCSGMLSTFLDNQARHGDPANRKNFDRSAHVLECPVESLPKLRASFRKRMQGMLQELHEALAAEQRRGGRGPVAAVGVTMFMHTSSPREPGGANSSRKPSPASRRTPHEQQAGRRAPRGRRP